MHEVLFNMKTGKEKSLKGMQKVYLNIVKGSVSPRRGDEETIVPSGTVFGDKPHYGWFHFYSIDGL